LSQQEVWTFASNSELKIVEKEEKKLAKTGLIIITELR